MFDTQVFKITLCTGIDLSTATGLDIMYKAPNKRRGSWRATLDPQDPTRMYINVATLEPGVWEVYGRAYFSSGVIPGDKAFFRIEREG